MQRSVIHQWRDWLLEYIGGNNYELINKDTLEVFAIVANDGMTTENQSQQIIKDIKTGRA